MSLLNNDSAIDGLYRTTSRECEAYLPPSGASSALSSQTSVFSEPSSQQSSIASSVCDDFRTAGEYTNDGAAFARTLSRCQISQPSSHAISSSTQAQYATTAGACMSYADATTASISQRQHPRRTSLARNQKPPTLQRQQDRKTHFVDSLVDSATQMVEVIWPLSVVHCSNGTNGSGQRGVLPLRTYIEETLRRSRTSYSTLQVALYYLVLLKAVMPNNDFTKEQHTDCTANRAIMCGRRMFLAALILASKYLQDRNYSAKAWSKMSGLPVAEINANERTFLAMVDFKLHIPDSIFSTWTEMVLKYTPYTPPSPPGCSIAKQSSWKSIIPLLTPQLDTVPLPASAQKPATVSAAAMVANYGSVTPATPTPTATPMHVKSTSHESTPTAKAALPPRFLEPRPILAPPTPALARMGPLPTPQLTPSLTAASTPAASACPSRRPSMCSAMAMAQIASFNRCALDPFLPSSKESCSFSRRPSVISMSSRSSPESMISDRSRPSRSSSISSISTISSHASLAHDRADLVRRATCRNARPPMPPATVVEEKEGTVGRPIVIGEDSEMTSSPEMTNFSISEKKLHMPNRHTKFAPTPVSAAAAAVERGRKRCRSRGGRRSDLHEEVRMMLEDELDLNGSTDIDDEMDNDDDIDNDAYDMNDAMTSPTPAAGYAARMLAAQRGMDVAEATAMLPPKCVQPPASLSRSNSCRMPVQMRSNGSKRSCCSTMRTVSSTPQPFVQYAEVA